MQRNTADESPNLTPAAVAAWLQTHAAHDAEVEAEVAQMTDGVVVTPTSSPRLDGNFPGSPVGVTYRFVLSGVRIR